LRHEPWSTDNCRHAVRSAANSGSRGEAAASVDLDPTALDAALAGPADVEVNAIDAASVDR
jgi:hypothetical protein